jgi:hypothetical protein
MTDLSREELLKKVKNPNNLDLSELSDETLKYLIAHEIAIEAEIIDIETFAKVAYAVSFNNRGASDE